MAVSRRYSPLFQVLLAFAVALAPQAAAAQQAAVESASLQAPLARVIDVELHDEGYLVGQLVTPSGAPNAATKVTLKLTDGRQAVATTNEQGGFAFRGVRGVATLQSEKSMTLVRAWAPGSAPPNAIPAVLLVENDGVARGQHYAGAGTQRVFSRGKMLMANPLFVAGVVATAVAIPVAIANDDDDPAS